MTIEGIKRKLVAILNADIEGYSRLMSQDEVGTIRTLTAYREAMATLIEQYKGRVVDSIGDNLLAEFASVVDAVNCAVEIQRDLAARNAEIPSARKMQFRIGVNLGDVVEEEDKIYGDGVNIAARIESLAEAGGVCISGTVYDQVQDKLGFEYGYLGEQEVKNIAKPVRVYRVLSFPVKHASVDRMAFPLPEKPSIAILPFVNMTGDPKQEHIADGLTDNIITALSKSPQLFVIASTSTFSYKGEPVKVSRVAEECGVRYVLEGSLQRSDNRLRIISQLCDAIKGHHLWSERYDREVKDIFTVQDEITMRILSAVHVKLTEADKTRLFEEVTDNLAAWEKYSEALMTPNQADWRPLLKESIELDPKFITPYVWMGFSYIFDVWLCSTKSPAQDIEKAIQWGQKALSVNDSTAAPHYLLGKIYNTKQQHEIAIPLAERAIELNPNSADAIFFAAQIYGYSGRPEEALDWNEKLYRMNPFPDPMWYGGLGTILNIVGRYDDAIRALEKALEMDPILYLRRFLDIELAKTYSLLGREKEAREAATEILTHSSMATAEYLVKSWGYIHRDDEERFIEALHRAGLPLEAPENMRFWEEF